MQHEVRILKTGFVTHDTKSFVVEKPEGYGFTPGQATDVTIRDFGKKGPFTFASLNSDLVLEFVIKRYEHHGLTEALHNLNSGDKIIIDDPFGTIHYEDEGVFIAGGAGITPFIAILRQLRQDGKLGNNILIFSNKTLRDVILEKELKEMFIGKPENLVLTLTREKKPGYYFGRIDGNFLKSRIKDFSRNFYVCGPDAFVSEMTKILKDLGASPETVVIEK
jgi:ferredoxin-NADP reductase